MLKSYFGAYFGFYKVIGYQSGEHIHLLYPILKWTWYPEPHRGFFRLISDIWKRKNLEKIYIPTPYSRDFKVNDKVYVNLPNNKKEFGKIIKIERSYYHVDIDNNTFLIVKKNYLSFATDLWGRYKTNMEYLSNIIAITDLSEAGLLKTKSFEGKSKEEIRSIIYESLPNVKNKIQEQFLKF